MQVTQITREQYVAIVECGGKAFGFYGEDVAGFPCNQDYAHRMLVDYERFDETPDRDEPSWVYYTLTE